MILKMEQLFKKLLIHSVAHTSDIKYENIHFSHNLYRRKVTQRSTPLTSTLNIRLTIRTVIFIMPFIE